MSIAVSSAILALIKLFEDGPAGNTFIAWQSQHLQVTYLYEPQAWQPESTPETTENADPDASTSYSSASSNP